MRFFDKKLIAFLAIALAGCNPGTYRSLEISSSNDAALRQAIAIDLEKSITFGVIGRFRIFKAEIYGPFVIEGEAEKSRPYYCIRANFGFADNIMLSKSEVALAVLAKSDGGNNPYQLDLVHVRSTKGGILQICNDDSKFRPFPELIAARDRERERISTQPDTPSNPN